MLCHDCHHIKVHGNLKKYRPILLKIASNIYHNKKSILGQPSAK